MAAASPQWKCGVCYTKTGDLVCSKCVTREAERRRDERAERLEALRGFRESAVKTMQERRAAIEREARLQKEAADERRLKEQVREFTHRVAEERIMVASAAFSLRQQRDLLAAAESHLSRETASTEEMKRAVLDGLRQHADDALRTLRQRRWRRVVQLFVLFPVAASIPPISDRSTIPLNGEAVNVGSQRGTGSERRGENRGVGLRRAATVSGVSTLVDLPLPNNGDYSKVPADVLMAALGLLTRLVVGIASSLGVTLPHPLFPSASMRYATVAVDSSPRERSSLYPLCSLSKLAEIGIMGAASSVCNTVGAFETALDLLRSDVVHLCVEGAKVPVDRLWPAEALLLNLWELQQHAISELRSSSPMVDVPLPMPRDPPEVSLNAVGRGGRVGRPSPGGYYDHHASHSTGLSPGAAVASGIIPEEEEDTYEFVVGEGVAASVVGEASGGGWWQR